MRDQDTEGFNQIQTDRVIDKFDRNGEKNSKRFSAHQSETRSEIVVLILSYPNVVGAQRNIDRLIRER